MTIAPHLFVIHHAKHVRPPKPRYVRVQFNLFSRTYEYKLGDHDAKVGDELWVPVRATERDNSGVHIAQVISVSRFPTHWRNWVGLGSTTQGRVIR